MPLARRAGELLLGTAVAMLPLASTSVQSAPTGVTFTAPAAGATISGSFSNSTGCQVTGTGIAKVVFFMDSTQLNTENYAPWQCKLDTRNFANGTHTLRAVAYDSAGASTTVTRTVTTVQYGSVSGPTGVTFTAPAAGATAAGRVFYDGFEDGTTNAWQQDDYRNRCRVVTWASDGGGPYAGTRMARCNWNGGLAWNDPAAFENLTIATDNYNDELFLRARIRLDPNMNAGAKLLRIFYFQEGIYHDLFESTGSGGGDGLKNEGAHTTNNLPTYWGDAPGDDTHINRSVWHKIEYYIRQSTGSIKVWHNGILVRNNTGVNFQGVKWSPFYIASNAEQPFDDTNHVYFDEVEVYSDRGTGATGAMSDATIEQ